MESTLKRLGATLLATSLIAACATTDAPPRPDPRPTGPVVERPPEPVEPTPTEEPSTPDPDETAVVEVEPSDARPGLAPAHLRGQDVARLGLLLPLSSTNARLREEAQGLLRGAQLALFNHAPETVLLVEDTKGTERGARDAAEAALDKGADILLGPVLAGEVRAAKRESGRTPVVAFSTDTDVAGGGTYLLSFPPEAEVERVVSYAASRGIRDFAILHPTNAYGERVADAYRSAVARAGGAIVATQSYSGSTVESMQGPVASLANQYRARPFGALLLPEGGTALRSLAPLLAYTDTRMAQVQLLGTALWSDATVAREPALRGGWFAAADDAARSEFERNYRNAFSTAPTRLASLAHDAVALAARVAEDGDTRAYRARLEDGSGLQGADGFVRLHSDGTPDRGLAVFQITSGGIRVADPAPRGVGIN